MAAIEREIMVELRDVAGNPKLKNKDLMEWSTGKIEPRDGEQVYFLPKLGVWCAVKVEPAKVKL